MGHFSTFGHLQKNSWKRGHSAARERVSCEENRGLLGTPLPPTPLKALTGAGFAKNGLQNLERLGLRGQNLDNKDFMAAGAVAVPVASALKSSASLVLRSRLDVTRWGWCLWISERAFQAAECDWPRRKHRFPRPANRRDVGHSLEQTISTALQMRGGYFRGTHLVENRDRWAALVVVTVAEGNSLLQTSTTYGSDSRQQITNSFEISAAGDPSLRLKSGSAREDAELGMTKTR
jgi:hypothetical protein